MSLSQFTLHLEYASLCLACVSRSTTRSNCWALTWCCTCVNRARSVGLDGVYCMAFIGFKIMDRIQLLGYALQYSTPKGTVNVVSSVKIGPALHLTRRGQKRKSFSDWSRSHSI